MQLLYKQYMHPTSAGDQHAQRQEHGELLNIASKKLIVTSIELELLEYKQQQIDHLLQTARR